MSERLISLFHTKPNETFSLKQLSSSLNLTTHPLKMLCADIITEMIEDDFLQEVEKRTLQAERPRPDYDWRLSA